jgi:hypothetical protein
MNLKVIPLGLNYNNYHQSQSRLLVNYGKPISVNDYLDTYEESKAQAMTKLRDNLFEKLSNEIVHIEDERAMQAYEVELERILPFYLDRSSGYSEARSQHHFYKSRERQVKEISHEDTYYRRIFIYDAEMDRWKLRAPFFFITSKDPGYWVVQNILLLVFFPVFLLSWIIHAPTYFTIRTVLARFVSDPQFHSSIKLVGMLVLFPVFGLIYALVLAILSDRPLLVALSMMLFFPLSIFIIREMRLPYRYCLTMWRMLFMKWRKPDLHKYLVSIETNILNHINQNRS